jgi:hypothetical protein
MTLGLESALPAAFADINIHKSRQVDAFMLFKFLGHLLKVLVTPNQTYRRRRGDSVWHFSTRCKYWPLKNFEETNDSPQFGVCSVCMRIEEDRKTPSYIP